LQAKNPQGSVDFDRTSFADMDALREEDNWLNVVNESFSIDKIRKVFERSPPLSA